MTQAHLADITSVEEQEFVVELLTASGGEDAWFGLTLLDSLSWSDGSMLSNESWYNITSNSNTICYRLQYQVTEGSIWNDEEACEDTNRYICEYAGI